MYQFNEKEHIHSLDGKPLIGVTTALGIIAKPALIQWAANMACDYILDHVRENECEKTEEGWVYKVYEDWIKEARNAHRKKKETAGDWGTNLHADMEKAIKYAIENENGYLRSVAFEGIKFTSSHEHFLRWATENQIKFLESEKHVYSKELWIGGILDMVFEMDGKKYIGDIKTSSAIYNEHFFQMAAYEMCLEEMGVKDIDGYIVINLKKDGTMDLKMAENREINKQAFKHALGLHKIINSLV